MCDVALKMSTKITASKEQMFRLQDCSEDDTIFMDLELKFLFGEPKEAHWRVLLPVSRSCWRRSGFYL